MRRLATLCCAALALGGPVGALSPTPPPAAAVESSLRLSPELRARFAGALADARSGDAAAAARELGDPVWSSTPLREYALLFQAQALARSGDAAAARAAISRTTAAAPDSRPVPTFLLEAAAVLTVANDDAGAAQLYRRFVDRHPDHASAPRARYALAQSLLVAGRLAEASRAFTELWLMAPASPQADDAARQLQVLGERGLVGTPPTARDRLERAERLLAAGSVEAARAEAEALIDKSLPPDLTARALTVVATAHRRAGRYDAALAVVNRALAELPVERRAPWLLTAAQLQQRRGRDAAFAALDRLVREYPTTPDAAEALGMKARLLEGAGRYADAEVVYAKLGAAYADHEDGATALWRLGWLAWFRGSYADAATHWERLAGAKGSRGYREAATYWTGRALEQRGDVDGAARRFALVRAEAPRSYYGLLASTRAVGAVERPAAVPFDLPADPREPLAGDSTLARSEALRSVGLTGFADEEMEELTRRSLGEPRRLYAVSAAYAQDGRPHLSLRILRRHFQAYARSGATGPRAFWELFYPIGWRTELTGAAGRAGADPFLVAAVVREESSYHAQARSPAGARGLMQLMPETARPMARARHLAFNNGDVLDDPGANLDMGASFLSSLLKTFGDPRLALAAYNAGPTRLREWWAARRSDDLEVFVEQIPFNETRTYVKRVMFSWEEYRRLYAASVEPIPREGGDRP